MMKLIHRTIGSLIICLALSTAARAQSADVAAARDGDDVTLTVTVHSGLHAQSHTPLDDSLIPLVVTPAAANGVTWGDINYPAPTVETLPAMGKISVYVGTVKIRVAVKAAADAALSGLVRLQACDDESCFPPEKLKWSIGAAAPTTAPASMVPAAPATVLPVAVTPVVSALTILLQID